MKYPEDTWAFREIEKDVFKSIDTADCLNCGEPTSYLSYRFPRPAIPVCSPECHQVLLDLQTEGLINIED
jgi:hypothetical protein